MTDTLETATEIQTKFLSALEASQKAAVAMVGTWAETVETVFSKLPQLALTEPVRPSQLMENALSFTEKIVVSQREFANDLFQAAMPVTQAAASAARAAEAEAASAGQAGRSTASKT